MNGELAFLQGRVDALETLCLALAKTMRNQEVLKTVLGSTWQAMYREMLANKSSDQHLAGAMAMERKMIETIGSFSLGKTPPLWDVIGPDQEPSA